MITIRYSFFSIFKETADGLTLRRKIRFGGVTFEPGTTFSRETSFGGVNIYDRYDQDVEADETDGILIIKDFYE